MNRRSFFTLATGAAFGLFLPRLEKVRWKKIGQLWEINPEWVNAPYEFVFFGFDGVCARQRFSAPIWDPGTKEIPKLIFK